MLHVPIRYINNGEPLDQVTLNRYMYDTQENLEELFKSLGAVSVDGEVQEIPNSLVKRDAYGTTQFSAPRVGTNPLRLNDSSVANTANKVVTRNSSGKINVQQVTLGSAPSANMDAATKKYVDDKISSVQTAIENNLYTIVSGHGQAYGWTDVVGGFRDNSNYFDVFPPSGKTMSDLVAFLPSIRMIHFDGTVDKNDSMRCFHVIMSDRIRIRVQNTEQRSHPQANYIGVWK